MDEARPHHPDLGQRRLTVAAALYLTMADVARLYHVSEPTARRWAREDSWRRTTIRPVRYHASDAQRSYDKRHGGRIARHLARHMADTPPAA